MWPPMDILHPCFHETNPQPVHWYWLLCRASFKGSSLLQDVRSHILQTRPDLNRQSYSIVSLHLGREFSAADLSSSLADLGVQSQTSLRLRSQQPYTGQTLLAAVLLSLLAFTRACNGPSNGRCVRLYLYTHMESVLSSASNVYRSEALCCCACFAMAARLPSKRTHVNRHMGWLLIRHWHLRTLNPTQARVGNHFKHESANTDCARKTEYAAEDTVVACTNQHCFLFARFDMRSSERVS